MGPTIPLTFPVWAHLRGWWYPLPNRARRRKAALWGDVDFRVGRVGGRCLRNLQGLSDRELKWESSNSGTTKRLRAGGGTVWDIRWNRPEATRNPHASSPPNRSPRGRRGPGSGLRLWGGRGLAGGVERGGSTRRPLKLGRVGFADGGRDPRAAPAGYYRSRSSCFLVLVRPPPLPNRELSPRRATAAGHVIRANMAAAAGGS